MTYAEALQTTIIQINSSQVNQSDPLELVCFVLGVTREEFYITQPSSKLSQHQVSKLNEVISDYNRSKPLAYILGKTEFLGHEIIIQPGVLIPRPETELLVEKFIGQLENDTSNQVLNILEIGTGSGCIISSIAKHLQDKGSSANIIGIDPSPTAFEVTKENIEHTLGIKLEEKEGEYEYKGDKLRIIIVNISIQEYVSFVEPTYIISNPPYITSEEMLDLDDSVVQFEPAVALDGGKDGLKVYRGIIDYGNKLKAKPALYLEISPTITKNVEQLFKSAGYITEVSEDQFGRSRFLFCK